MKYLYIFKSSPEYKELCFLELTNLFSNDYIYDNHVLSNLNIDIEISPFIKFKIELINYTSDFDKLVEQIDDNTTSGFLIKYVECYSQEKVSKQSKNNFCKEIGMKYVNDVEFNNPKIIFAITKIDNIFYYGKLQINKKKFLNRNNKPKSYSNSLDIVIAKSSLNIVSEGNKKLSIVDPCCGVGTVVIEGLSHGYDIVGSDINFKVVNNANYNLNYFNLKQVCHCSDIDDIQQKYDCAIIDLPYGLFSSITDDELLNIILNSKRIANKIVLISSKDISNFIKKAELNIIEQCDIVKTLNREFKRILYKLD